MFWIRVQVWEARLCHLSLYMAWGNLIAGLICPEWFSISARIPRPVTVSSKIPIILDVPCLIPNRTIREREKDTFSITLPYFSTWYPFPKDLFFSSSILPILPLDFTDTDGIKFLFPSASFLAPRRLGFDLFPKLLYLRCHFIDTSSLHF